MLGSKIENLIKMKERGIHIPDFFVIKFSDVINIEQYQKELETLVNDSKVTGEDFKHLLEKHMILELDIPLDVDVSLYAVRSSCNIEDGEQTSFAGQYKTYLNVRREDLKSKIKDCILSLFETNVLDYLRESNLDVRDLEMNVIVQEMVNPEYSGVLFTANPQGILNESVIVAGCGVGEGVVSDKVDTTSYYYNLNDKIYYYEGETDYLANEMIEELISVSCEIKEILGEFLDIEFAIVNETVYILQARKITTISGTDPLILDNSNIVESYPGISLPLTCSFVNHIYSGVFRGVSQRILKNEKELSKHEEVFNHMVGSANGRIYYKISNWYTLIKFLPMHNKIIPVWQEMLGVKNKSYDNKEVELSFVTRCMTYFNSIYELLSVPGNMKKLNDEFIRVNQYFYDVYREDIELHALVRLYHEIEERLLSVWDITLLNDMYTFIYTGLLKSRLKKKYKKSDDYINEYISGISNIESLKPIREMIHIAYHKDAYTTEEYNEVKRNYIENYGDRNLEELKLESETFRSNPDIFEDKISDYRKDLDKLADVYHKINEKKEFTFSGSGLTRFLIKNCTKGISNREISRLNRSRIFGMVRTIFLTLGSSFAKSGLMQDKRDIFYLTVEEAFDLVENPVNVNNTIEKRKEAYALYKLLPGYSRIIFEEKEFDKSHKSVNSKKMTISKAILQGIPCSNGIVEGEVLVVNDVGSVENVRDKILVTKMTDPGWVFLLATAKGVISEKGSLLSHTAIISRELKTPSIVGVDNVLSILESGDYIKMNGNTGKIEIMKKHKR